MPSSDEDQPPAPVQMVAKPANLLMASDPDGCEQLKRRVNGEDAMTTMVVVLAKTEEQGSCVHKNQEESKPRMDPRLLMALRMGNLAMLERLLTAKLIEMLIWEDPELACIPYDGTSPLYLAISSSELCLHCVLQLFQSCGFSPSGPDGQNVLHIAVFRDVVCGKGTYRHVMQTCLI